MSPVRPPDDNAADEENLVAGSRESNNRVLRPQDGKATQWSSLVRSGSPSASGGGDHWSLLLLVALVPFGGHLFKSAMSALQPLLAMSTKQYGLLFSAFALPNATVAPVIGGILFDLPRVRKHALVMFALIALVGGLICAGGVGSTRADSGALAAAYFGAALLGMGQGCIVVACRAAASSYSHINFAQGILVGVANLASFTAKASAATLADATSVHLALATLVVVQIGSLIAAMLQPRKASTNSSHACRWQSHHAGLSFKRMCCASNKFLRSNAFWLIAISHAVVVVGFKVFENYSSVILVAAYGYNPQKAGLVASVVPLASVFLAPLIGLASDAAHSSGVPIVLATCCALVGFGLLALAPYLLPPPAPVLMLAVAHAVLPTLLLARVPATVDDDSIGVAFGVCEILAAIGNVLVHAASGWIAANQKALPDHGSGSLRR